MNLIGSDDINREIKTVTNRQSYSKCYLNVDFAYSILKNASVKLLSRLNNIIPFEEFSFFIKCILTFESILILIIDNGLLVFISCRFHLDLFIR